MQFSKNDGIHAESDRVVGLTGLEPVTLRLSSACSNQLSYKPTVWFVMEAVLAAENRVLPDDWWS